MADGPPTPRPAALLRIPDGAARPHRGRPALQEMLQQGPITPSQYDWLIQHPSGGGR
jgi:hypothetical protein